ncbi:SDR family NAD(P)-dependent oxidoreductase [Arvimicrobium flavum]|uniref:SDR family NAD(P)-dependent oxidoreductase n=1 Tax=Arvimicrobium flavum TaxID=3393320 RepID=UPI00237B02A7|nr:SDR family oxidoreductase [Mesorhizobium shangrilense]
MLLDGKTAIVFGGGGAIGGAVAKAFAREGASVFLSGRHAASVEAVAADIRASGGKAQTAVVDALDETAVERHTAEVAERWGGIDVMLNAMGFQPVQGVPLMDLSPRDFSFPIATWTSSQFLTARAAGRHMVKKDSGVILTLSASPARLALAGTGGFGVACAAVEGLSRTLAAEFGPQGVRVVCIRPQRIGETMSEADFPVPRDEFIGVLEGMTLTKRLPTLADVANTAAFLASNQAAAMSGAVANLTCGMSVD